MKSAQFVRDMVNGVSSTFESADLAQVLPKEYQYLTDLKTLGTTYTHDANTRFFAQTVITLSEPDSMGRRQLRNHTVCFCLDPYLKHDGTYYFYSPEYFEKAYNEGTYNFTMPPLPTLTNPLPTPAWR